MRDLIEIVLFRQQFQFPEKIHIKMFALIELYLPTFLRVDISCALS